MSNFKYPQKKGMIFAGCSFTWGQGLWFYSRLDTLVNPKNKWGYEPNLSNFSHNKFKEANRFSRIVSNFMGSYDFVHPKNGGANDQIIKYWETCLESPRVEYLEAFNPGDIDETIPIRYDEISHVIFQLTQNQRDKFYYEVDGEIIDVPLQWNLVKEHKKYMDLFQKYIEKNGISLFEFFEDNIKNSLERVVTFLKKCEERGIKTYIIQWPKQYSTHIEKNEWARKRWIKLEDKEVYYDSIEDLLESKSSLSICEDTVNFEVPPNDCHPSLEAHRIIARSIINFIKREENG